MIEPEKTLGSADATREGAFVGRARELALLRASLEEATIGHGRLVLLAGEPGIGKTRTADEVCAEASSRGVRVLWGRCHEGEGAPAYWPWVQAIRAHARESPAPTASTPEPPRPRDSAPTAPVHRARTPRRRPHRRSASCRCPARRPAGRVAHDRSSPPRGWLAAAPARVHAPRRRPREWRPRTRVFFQVRSWSGMAACRRRMERRSEVRAAVSERIRNGWQTSSPAPVVLKELLAQL